MGFLIAALVTWLASLLVWLTALVVAGLRAPGSLVGTLCMGTWDLTRDAFGEGSYVYALATLPFVFTCMLAFMLAALAALGASSIRHGVRFAAVLVMCAPMLGALTQFALFALHSLLITHPPHFFF